MKLRKIAKGLGWFTMLLLTITAFVHVFKPEWTGAITVLKDLLSLNAAALAAFAINQDWIIKQSKEGEKIK